MKTRTLLQSPWTGETGSAKGCLIAGLLALLLLGGCTMFSYNGMVSEQEGVEAAWVGIQNQYKRRMEMVPQLVETVKGAAEFEQETMTAVTEARAAVGKVQLPDTLPDDPAALEQYFEAQDKLGQGLGRLLLVAENYPDLKASQNFLSLQDQLEGTENRIAVARTDYIEAVRGFNTLVRRFPANLIAGVFGFEKMPQLEFEEDVSEVPEIDFDFKQED